MALSTLFRNSFPPNSLRRCFFPPYINNQQVTSNPTVYNNSPSKKVRVILARTATGILGGNTCGVTYLNSLN